ncbi:MAG: cytochrome-c peroxidase [Bacteroidetes bacterium]|nr:cytochrome-c peroxidase [Bacteroidota bacterium]
MKKHLILVAAAISAILIGGISACKKKTTPDNTTYPVIRVMFSGKIDPDKLDNYSAQTRPAYITKDNSGATPITNAGATLGRVLFYDKKLSVNNTISCASCHKQEFAFGDDARLSQGVNGLTGRHSMRLANARFSQEMRFFWDERAATLEEQTTRPIQDHAEMGFSGQNGDPGLDDLIVKLTAVDYYKELFTLAFGDPVITENRLQSALSQFVRSIQSFDSKFDAGLSATGNINADFSNFTNQENQGKRIFLAPPGGPQPGAGCQGCHRAPEFDIDPASRNNGIIQSGSDSTKTDFTVTRSPSLRNVLNSSGRSNGPFMHTGRVIDLTGVVNHYNQLPNAPANNNLDPRLNPGGSPQNLGLNNAEKQALVAFLATLSGSAVYSDKKWSDPFAP